MIIGVRKASQGYESGSEGCHDDGRRVLDSGASVLNGLQIWPDETGTEGDDELQTSNRQGRISPDISIENRNQCNFIRLRMNRIASLYYRL
jgi:hypothetical protein